MTLVWLVFLFNARFVFVKRKKAGKQKHIQDFANASNNKHIHKIGTQTKFLANKLSDTNLWWIFKLEWSSFLCLLVYIYVLKLNWWKFEFRLITYGSSRLRLIFEQNWRWKTNITDTIFRKTKTTKKQVKNNFVIHKKVEKICKNIDIVHSMWRFYSTRGEWQNFPSFSSNPEVKRKRFLKKTRSFWYFLRISKL